jgi:hypothetical protein
MSTPIDAPYKLKQHAPPKPNVVFFESGRLYDGRRRPCNLGINQRKREVRAADAASRLRDIAEEGRNGAMPKKAPMHQQLVRLRQAYYRSGELITMELTKAA